MSAQPLKHLQVRQTQLSAEVDQLTKTMRELQRQLAEKNQSLNIVRKEIREITEMKPIVSEHALLRYCERILNVDLKEIEQKLLSDKNIEIIEQIRSGKIPVDNFMMVVKNKVVTTIES
jgi:septal ring factor EnvC (AmiA/AmiB activator)